jgi:E3 ubiquitin-protein ligase UBR4
LFLFSRHNTYLYEATRHRDIGYQSTIHDLKLLLLRFAQDKSFSSESGGGGPQSNMNLVPYLVHMSLYVLNTTRAMPREEKNLMAFVEATKDRWMESCFVADGPFFYAALAMLVFSPTRWKTHRVAFLQRLLLLAHVRAVSYFDLVG